MDAPADSEDIPILVGYIGMHCSRLSLRFSFQSMRMSILSLVSVFVASLLFVCSDCAAAPVGSRNQASAAVVLELNTKDSLMYIDKWQIKKPSLGASLGAFESNHSPQQAMKMAAPKKVRLTLGQTEIQNYYDNSYLEFRERVDDLVLQGAQFTSAEDKVELHGSHVVDISILAHFKNLQDLNLSSTGVNNIESLDKLVNLQNLKLYICRTSL